MELPGDYQGIGTPLNQYLTGPDKSAYESTTILPSMRRITELGRRLRQTPQEAKAEFDSGDTENVGTFNFTEVVVKPTAPDEKEESEGKEEKEFGDDEDDDTAKGAGKKRRSNGGKSIRVLPGVVAGGTGSIVALQKANALSTRLAGMWAEMKLKYEVEEKNSIKMSLKNEELLRANTALVTQTTQLMDELAVANSGMLKLVEELKEANAARASIAAGSTFSATSSRADQDEALRLELRNQQANFNKLQQEYGELDRSGAARSVGLESKVRAAEAKVKETIANAKSTVAAAEAANKTKLQQAEDRTRAATSAAYQASLVADRAATTAADSIRNLQQQLAGLKQELQESKQAAAAATAEQIKYDRLWREEQMARAAAEGRIRATADDYEARERAATVRYEEQRVRLAKESEDLHAKVGELEAAVRVAQDAAETKKTEAVAAAVGVEVKRLEVKALEEVNKRVAKTKEELEAKLQQLIKAARRDEQEKAARTLAVAKDTAKLEGREAAAADAAVVLMAEKRRFDEMILQHDLQIKALAQATSSASGRIYDLTQELEAANKGNAELRKSFETTLEAQRVEAARELKALYDDGKAKIDTQAGMIDAMQRSITGEGKQQDLINGLNTQLAGLQHRVTEEQSRASEARVELEKAQRQLNDQRIESEMNNSRLEVAGRETIGLREQLDEVTKSTNARLEGYERKAKDADTETTRLRALLREVESVRDSAISTRERADAKLLRLTEEAEKTKQDMLQQLQEKKLELVTLGGSSETSARVREEAAQTRVTIAERDRTEANRQLLAAQAARRAAETDRDAAQDLSRRTTDQLAITKQLLDGETKAASVMRDSSIKAAQEAGDASAVQLEEQRKAYELLRGNFNNLVERYNKALSEQPPSSSAAPALAPLLVAPVVISHSDDDEWKQLIGTSVPATIGAFKRKGFRAPHRMLWLWARAALLHPTWSSTTPVFINSFASYTGGTNLAYYDFVRVLEAACGSSDALLSEMAVAIVTAYGTTYRDYCSLRLPLPAKPAIFRPLAIHKGAFTTLVHELEARVNAMINAYMVAARSATWWDEGVPASSTTGLRPPGGHLNDPGRSYDHNLAVLLTQVGGEKKVEGQLGIIA